MITNLTSKTISRRLKAFGNNTNVNYSLTQNASSFVYAKPTAYDIESFDHKHCTSKTHLKPNENRISLTNLVRHVKPSFI